MNKYMLTWRDAQGRGIRRGNLYKEALVFMVWTTLFMAMLFWSGTGDAEVLFGLMH